VCLRLPEEIADEVRADEPTAAGDQDFHKTSSSLRTAWPACQVYTDATWKADSRTKAASIALPLNPDKREQQQLIE
jgi:hypothetical protein